MLNLFKLPFRVKNRSVFESGNSHDLTTGLLTSFLKHKKNLTDQEFDRACEIANREMEDLQQKFQEPGADNYELMTAALRRIEQGLK